MEYIAVDAHKRYTQVSVETEEGERRYEGRIAHARGALQQFLTICEPGSPVALDVPPPVPWTQDKTHHAASAHAAARAAAGVR